MKSKDLDKLIFEQHAKTFKPGFAKRVLNRIEGQKTALQTDKILLKQFYRIAATAAVVAGFIIFSNLRYTAQDELNHSAIESILAIPPNTIDAAFYLNI